MSFLLLLICAFGTTFMPGFAALDDDVLRKLSALERSVHQLEAENEKIHNDVTRLMKGTISKRRQLSKQLKVYPTDPAVAMIDIRYVMDTMWLLICAILIMFMQAGFAMVEAGTCRVINVQNILLKNLVDVCVGTICWFAFGWSIAYGFDDTMRNENVFSGNLQYFGHEFLEADASGNQVATELPRDWFFQWTFCATSATIVSGGVAERINFPGYLIFTVCMTTFIYPVIVAWTWSQYGWLAAGSEKHLNEVGFNDFAGSGIIHMTGGIAALVGAIVIGPRKGRFDDPDGDPGKFNPHNLPYIVIGTFILWCGWYGFNCGSTLGMSSTQDARLAAVVALNTTLAGSVGGITVLVCRRLKQGTYDLGAMCNGILGGLVSITAGCANVEFGSAIVIGISGGLICTCSSIFIKFMKIDDPIDAFSVHGACGCWGVLAAALFDWGNAFDKYNGYTGHFNNAKDLNGNTDGLWKSGFAAAIVEIVVIIAWVGGLSTLIFVPMRLVGLLRATDEVQDQGMDAAKHSPVKAYYVEGHGIVETGIV